MSEEEMCTVHVSSSGTEQPSAVTITVTPTSIASSVVTEGVTMSADQEGVIATSALQMVEDVDIMDDDSYRATLVVSDPKPEQATVEEECYVPDAKRQRLETSSENDGLNLKALLFSMNRAICMRLDTIESKVKQLQNFCHDLDGKVNKINATLDSMGKGSPTKQSAAKTCGSTRKPRATIVGLPPGITVNSPESSPAENMTIKEMTPLLDKKTVLDASCSPLGANVTLITLNREDDYPTGSWLGDPNNVQARVRCGVSATDMLHVMETSRTADKCALKLMDYLFDREVQATSNLSGTGKHGKKQLDPLMIYGIRCHLINKFGISEDDWHRIKLNIDSKCRTAFRRKQRGLPLKVKAFHCTKLRGSNQIDEESEESILESTVEGANTSLTEEPHEQMQRIHVQLHELPDGQVAAVPTVPVTLTRADNGQNRVQLPDGQQIAISESAQIQIAQMCSQDIPPGTTLVMTQADTQGTGHEGSIVMRLTSEGNCLEQVEPAVVQAIHEGFVEQSAQGTDPGEKTEPAGISEDQNSTDILVEIQQDECV